MEATNKTAYTAPTICQTCQHGGKVVEQCNCPYLKPWGIVPRTLKNTLALSNIEAVAKSKGVADFNPLPFAAVSVAVANEQCKYFKPITTKI